jgi:methionyl aminopeptidase
MIIIKSPREIELMKAAGQVVAGVFKEIKPLMRAGVCTKAIADKAESYIKSKGAYPTFKNYNGFPGSVCISVNDVIIHGIPSKKTILKEGDIVSVDVGATLNGYVGDACRTFAVGEISKEAEMLIETTKQSFFEALKVVKPGARIGDISAKVQHFVESAGYSILKDFTGHGIGKSLHEDPNVPNYGKEGTGALIKEGMCICIEPMVALGSDKYEVLNDGWTVRMLDRKISAHYENSIAITKDGIIILTMSEEENELNG